MPVNPTYPGVYLQEVSSGVHTITGVATSITAFIGRAQRGPTNDPQTIFGFGDYTRIFGGLWAHSPMSYAVQQFYQNGGNQAIIVRVHKGATAAKLELGAAASTLKAASEGDWGNKLRAIVTNSNGKTFNLQVNYSESQNDPGITETYFNLSVDPLSPRYVNEVLSTSSLVRVSGNFPTDAAPAKSPPPAAGSTDPFSNAYAATANSGSDGNEIDDNAISDPDLLANKEGLWAFSKVDLFNLLCIPPLAFNADGSTTGIGIDSTVSAALTFCEKRRAFFIVDPPIKWSSVDLAAKGMLGDAASVSLPANNHGAVFFPYVIAPDALSENRLTDFAPCGVMAGIFATTDAQRGVWKAPAGVDAMLSGVAGLAVAINDNDNGRLNPLGVNCLRSFPVTGRVAWGSRTLRGADQLTDDYKYIPVRRTALFIEESLYRGLQWAVFEPNDEPLWAQIRLNVGAFMQDLFRKGAFQGKTPRDAYLVKCDKETTTQNDINLGIVNILVGFAPLKPAEFVIITIQQLAGQIQV